VVVDVLPNGNLVIQGRQEALAAGGGRFEWRGGFYHGQVDWAGRGFSAAG
jgi:hypothetical protein